MYNKFYLDVFQIFLEECKGSYEKFEYFPDLLKKCIIITNDFKKLEIYYIKKDGTVEIYFLDEYGNNHYKPLPLDKISEIRVYMKKLYGREGK